MQIYTHSTVGFRGALVAVEVDVRRGIPGTEIVGLPGSAVREARERVRVAVRRSGLQYPMDRILVNLSPAGIRKDGTNFDLAVAVAILCASDQLFMPSCAVLGELQLTGHVLPVRGVLTAAAEAAEAGITNLVVPDENAAEACALGRCSVLGVSSLKELRSLFGRPTADSNSHFSAAVESWRANGSTRKSAALRHREPPRPGDIGFSSIQGQPRLKRALEVAAAGRHSVLMVGPPGSGKTLAANALPSIIPPLTREESLVTSRIHSLSGVLDPSQPLLRRAPFRAPHHTASREGITGGGRLARPGEVSLAHNGVLFLDEAPEFRKHVLQALREPIEDHTVRVVRAEASYVFPADFQLVLAANPCPCGLAGGGSSICLCSGNAIEAYWQRLGGPLLDRIDVRISVRSEEPTLRRETLPESESAIARRVVNARAAQRKRFDALSQCYNSRVSANLLDELCPLTPELAGLLQRASEHVSLSRRAQSAVRRVARTIADLEGSDRVEPEHLLEAVQHRRSAEESLSLLARM